LVVNTAPWARRDPVSGLWHLSAGQYWIADHAKSPLTALGGATRQTMIPFQERKLAIALNPLWLSWYNLAPQYIPLSVLHQLALSDDIPDAHGQYATRFYVVIAEAFLPVGMALLAASLSMLFLAYATSAPALIGIVFAGYTAHFAIKAGLILGQNGFVPPLLAGFTVPVLLFAATACVLTVCARQSRGH
jgi:lipopolysaccharide export LptBFGC system permease protein LptF